MKFDYVTLAIIAVTAVTIAGLVSGHDGIIISAAIGTIGGLGGFKAGVAAASKNRDKRQSDG